jgi:hypothetical protein
VGVGGASARARMASTLGVTALIRWERHPYDAKARNLDAVRELWRAGNSGSVGIAGTQEVGTARALGEEKNKRAKKRRQRRSPMPAPAARPYTATRPCATCQRRCVLPAPVPAAACHPLLCTSETDPPAMREKKGRGRGRERER